MIESVCVECGELIPLDTAWYAHQLNHMKEHEMTEGLKHRFDYHPPKDEGTKARHEGIRAGAFELAEEWDGVLPDCREKALAITYLEMAMFWSNAAIARNQ